MSLFTILGRLRATLLLVLRQRLELAALDVQDEMQRLGVLLEAALFMLTMWGFALAAAAAGVILLFWDSARLAAVWGVSGFFLLLGLGLLVWLRRAWKRKPRFMATTLAELEKDAGLWSSE